MSLPGLIYQISIYRYQSKLDSEGTPVGRREKITSCRGYVKERNAKEAQNFSGALGNATYAKALIPYRTNIKEQDLLEVAYPDRVTIRTYRVTAVRDNRLCIVCDLNREVA